MDGQTLKNIFLQNEHTTQTYVALHKNVTLQVISYLLVGAGKEKERS